jgi:hypothetical protein
MQCYASKRGWSALIVIALVLVFSPCVVVESVYALGDPEPDAVIHVDIKNGSVNPPNFGRDGWSSNAHRYLRPALADAEFLINGPFSIETVEIWVAAGTYLPDQGTGYTLEDRSHSFALRTNVAIYGHFAGSESSLNERDLDNPAYETILSGDLLEDDEPVIATYDDGYLDELIFDLESFEDNSVTVVLANSVGVTAILDGFTVRGGVSIIDSSIAMRNCTVTANAHGVPALHIAGNSEPRIFQCTFDSSHSRPVIIEGGAQPVFIDCTIDGEFCNLRTAADFGPPPHLPHLPQPLFRASCSSSIFARGRWKFHRRRGGKPLESRITMLYS